MKNTFHSYLLSQLTKVFFKEILKRIKIEFQQMHNYPIFANLWNQKVLERVQTEGVAQ